jgi:hypothetical protein
MRTDGADSGEPLFSLDETLDGGKRHPDHQVASGPAEANKHEAERQADRRSEWLRKLDEECPYQVVLPRGPVGTDDAIMKFLEAYVGKFDMYVEDEYAVFVRYCFADPLDAAIFRSRFEHRASRFRLAG